MALAFCKRLNKKEYNLAEVIVKSVVDAPVSEVWASWDDFGNIERFNPNVKKSFLIDGSKVTGLGATRQCDFADGKNYIQERIVEYIPQKKMVVDIYNGTVPLKSATAQIELNSISDHTTEVIFTMNFVPKMGLFGRLLIPLMKPQFRKDIGKLVDGNKAHVEKK